MTRTNTPATLELSINGFSCAATVTRKGRIEFSVRGTRTIAAKQDMMRRIASAIKSMARGVTPDGVYAQMAGTRAKARNFCSKVVEGVQVGELSVYWVMAPTAHVAGEF